MHALVYASPYVYSGMVHGMLWVAGGSCASKMCNRIRGERYRGTRLVALPSLKLSLSIFIIILYYLT